MKNLTHQRRTRRGFTIIELMICIAIMGMLMTLILPAVHHIREHALRTYCQNSLRQLVIGWMAFPADHGNKMVNSLPDDKNGWVKRGPGYGPIEGGMLFPYVKTLGVWRCPSDETGNERSYSIVAPLHGEHWNTHLKTPNHTWAQAGTDNMADVIDPSRQMVILEELDARGWNIGSWIMFARQSQKWNWIDYMAVFHLGKGTNISFADGHVSYWIWDDPQTLWAAHNGQFFLTDPGNADWLRVRQQYRLLPEYPDIPALVK